MNRPAILALALLLGATLAPATADASTVFINSDIVASETWTADNEYVLGKVIYVTSGSTLTIEPGTLVRGEPESSPGANDPGTLVVTRGSKIRALGTADDPIVFTDLFDDNVGSNPGTPPYDTALNALSLTGQWGGVVVLGYAYVANNSLSGPNAAREVQIEGLTPTGGLGFYGNCAASALFPSDCDDDDSGVLNYVSIRYGGFNLSAANEINGLTLGGVGRETEIRYVEVFQNKDDGVEFFGGAAQIKNFAIANVGDDGVDYDEGWRGKGQFVFTLHGTPGADRSDKGGEHDGGNGPDGSRPFATPMIYNATFVGLGQKAHSTKNTNTGLHFRDNAGGRYYNSLLADFGGAAMLIEGATTDPLTSGERTVTSYVTPSGNCSVTTSTSCQSDANCPGGEVCVIHYGAPASTYQLELRDNTFWCLGAGSLIPTAGATAATYGGANQAHTDPGIFTNPALGNVYAGCGDPLPILDLQRFANPSPTAPDPVVQIDPRPAAGQLATGRVPPADGFFEPAPYRGAFHSNWASGSWSALGRLGYFPECDTVLAPDAVPDEVPNLEFAPGSTTTLVWDRVRFNARNYDVVRKAGTVAASAADFSLALCLESGDYDLTAEDSDVPGSAEVFFYLVNANNDCGEGSLGLRSDGAERMGPNCL